MSALYSWPLEEAILGGAILDPTQIPDVDAILGTAAFHRPQHGALWGLLRDAHAAGAPLGLELLIDAVARDADRYGGVAYVASLPGRCSSVEGLTDHARRVREYADQRGLLQSLRIAAERIKDGEAAASVVTALRGALDGVGDVSASPWISSARLATDVSGEVLRREPGVLPGVSTGLRDLDELLWGLRPGQSIVVAGRPAMGKSAFAGHVARSCGAPAGIVSLEMSAGQWMERWAVAEAGLSADQVRKGRMNAADRRALEDAFERLYEGRVWITDAPAQDMRRIAASCRRLVRDHGARLVVIDYLGLVQADNPRASAYEATTEISRGVKALAKELRVPVMLLCQLNRSCEGRTDKRPTTADLRDSGAIEQDADTVILLYRDEVYHPDTADKGILELIIPKQRGGGTGTIRVACDLARMSIRDLARDGGGYF